MIRAVTTTLFILVLLINANAQKVTEGRSIYDQPNQLIARLASGGAILVRLNTAEKQLELLQKMTLTEKVEKLERELTIENEEIRAAFSEELPYINKVFFFKSSDSPEIRLGNFNGYLSDAKGNIVPNDRINFDTYVIAEFARTEEMGIPALVVYDDQFNQLSPPFPYFIRTYESLPLVNRTHRRTVHLFNERLESFSKFHPEK
tara:strand:- start:297 stop:908 length:612 start_codon:yes stop_codon:yes gene_type:complete